jgi:hypothetical protein
MGKRDEDVGGRGSESCTSRYAPDKSAGSTVDPAGPSMRAGPAGRLCRGVQLPSPPQLANELPDAGTAAHASTVEIGDLPTGGPLRDAILEGTQARLLHLGAPAK